MDRSLIEAERESFFWTGWQIQMTVPSVLATGEEFSLRMTAFTLDDLPSDGFDRRIVFEESPGVEGLPESVHFEPGSGGCVTVEGLRAVGPDHLFVTARAEGGPTQIVSNGAWVFDDPPFRVYWGDLHVHTVLSNCGAWASRGPEFGYAYARDATHLDFMAAVDHLDGIASEPDRWPRLRAAARKYDDPGRFVTFLAFESAHKSGYGGDNNAFFLGFDAPYFWRDELVSVHPAVQLRELWDFLDSTGEAYFTAPHHSGRGDKYRSFDDPVYDRKREPIFEMCSTWGCSESKWTRFASGAGNADGPCFFQDALRAGCRYGVYASSDTHRTQPGRQRGLAAVRAATLDRNALWESLNQRNCYGTTMARSLLDLSIGDVAMGREAPIGRDDPLRRKREIRVRYFATQARGTHVVLVRNGHEIASKPWAPAHPEVVFQDEDAADAVAVRESRFHPDPFVVYYVRVQNHKGQTQWSSPIWLDLA